MHFLLVWSSYLAFGPLLAVECGGLMKCIFPSYLFYHKFFLDIPKVLMAHALPSRSWTEVSRLETSVWDHSDLPLQLLQQLQPLQPLQPLSLLLLPLPLLVLHVGYPYFCISSFSY
jgi:hypothetical protein